jgi:hypothetical protein
MITAIMFGSAARRCSGENIISRYQMTVLVEALFAETLLFEDSRRRFSCGVRELRSSSRKRGIQRRSFLLIRPNYKSILRVTIKES